MLRKTSGVETTEGVVETICVTYEDVAPVEIPPVEEPAWPWGEPPFAGNPRPRVETSPNDNNTPINTNPFIEPEPVGVLYVEILYFDPIQERIIQRFAPCRNGIFNSGGTGWPNVAQVTILTPGGCG